MVNTWLRAALAEQIGWLLDGEIGDDEFENFLYDEGCLGSNDRAVDEIAWWASALYSDTSSRRLPGRNLLDRDTYQTGERAILFLQSDLEYAWPSLQEPYSVFLLRALQRNWWLSAAACLLVSLYCYRFQAGGIALGPLLVMATMCLGVACKSAGRLADRLMSGPKQAFGSAGNIDCWPFLNEEQLGSATRALDWRGQ